MPYASVKLKYEFIQTSLHSFSCLSFRSQNSSKTTEERYGQSGAQIMHVC
jgi:hypothetical protein